MDFIPKDWVYDAETGRSRHPNTSPDEIRKAYETGERVQIAHALTLIRNRIISTTDIFVLKDISMDLNRFIYKANLDNNLWIAATKLKSDLSYKIDACRINDNVCSQKHPEEIIRFANTQRLTRDEILRLVEYVTNRQGTTLNDHVALFLELNPRIQGVVIADYLNKNREQIYKTDAWKKRVKTSK